MAVMVRAAPTTPDALAGQVWTVASPMPRLAPDTTAVLRLRLRFMTLQSQECSYKTWIRGWVPGPARGR